MVNTAMRRINHRTRLLYVSIPSQKICHQSDQNVVPIYSSPDILTDRMCQWNILKICQIS